jgi:hypothetical protein
MDTVTILSIILGLSGVFVQRSKILALIIFFFVWTLAWTTTLPDYVNYKYGFEHETFKDVGYQYVSSLFLNYGVPFFNFMISFIGAGIVILALFVIKFAKRCSLVSALYLWTTARYDIVQYRNFVAFTIILIGVYVLIQYKNKISRIIFGALTLVAASVHVTTIFYAMFVVADKRFIRKVSKIWLVILVVSVAVLGNYFFADVLDSKFERYDVGVSMLTRTLLSVLFIGNLIFIIYVNKRQNSSKLTRAQSQYVDPNVNFVVLANTFLMILIPAAFLSLNAMRIFRYMAIINLIFISNKFSDRVFGIVGNTIVIILYSAIYAFICYVMHISEYQNIIDSITYDNLFY